VTPESQRAELGRKTKAAIVEAALRMLGRDGPEAITATALAREARISKATIFHHFRAMDEIPAAALELFWTQVLDQKASKTTSLRGYLEELGEQMFDLAEGKPTFLKTQMVFVTKAMFDRALHRKMEAGWNRMHRRLSSALRARLPRHVSEAEGETLTRLVEMALDGVMLDLAADDSKAGIEKTRRAWARFIQLFEGNPL